jgi:hypothetical protein
MELVAIMCTGATGGMFDDISRVDTLKNVKDSVGGKQTELSCLRHFLPFTPKLQASIASQNI